MPNFFKINTDHTVDIDSIAEMKVMKNPVQHKEPYVLLIINNQKEVIYQKNLDTPEQGDEIVDSIIAEQQRQQRIAIAATLLQGKEIIGELSISTAIAKAKQIMQLA